MRFFFAIFLFIALTRGSLVVFEAFRDANCATHMWAPSRRLYLPLLDRPQGIDSQVSSTIYSGNPPGSTGQWTSVTESNATLCNGGSCQTWPVWPTLNLT